MQFKRDPGGPPQATPAGVVVSLESSQDEPNNKLEASMHLEALAFVGESTNKMRIEINSRKSWCIIISSASNLNLLHGG